MGGDSCSRALLNKVCTSHSSEVLAYPNVPTTRVELEEESSANLAVPKSDSWEGGRHEKGVAEVTHSQASACSRFK